MKAKFKPLIILIAVFMFSLVAGIVAGCSIGEETAKEFADKRGLTCPVTYYVGDGGNFKLGRDNIDTPYRTLYYAPESPILNIGVVPTTSQPIFSIGRRGYLFKGWRYCLLDDNGNPVLKDASGNVLKYLDNGTADMTEVKDGEEVQMLETKKRFFAQPDPDRPEEVFENGNVIIHEGQHLFLVAEWIKDAEIQYILDGIGEGKTMKVNVTTGDETVVHEWEDGDIISSELFERSDTKNVKPDSEPEYNFDPDTQTEFAAGTTIEITSHTYISLYMQKGGVDPIIGSKSFTKTPYDPDDPEKDRSIKVYVMFFENKEDGSVWHPVRDTDDVKNIFNYTGTAIRTHYLVNDIDCQNTTITPKARGTAANDVFKDSIDGNGHTISNIKVARTTPQSGRNISLFGKIASGVEIKDLTIENIEYVGIVIMQGRAVPIHVVAYSIDDDATLTNFKIGGTVKVTVTRQNKSDKAAISNLTEQGDGSFVATNSWFGSEDFATNAEFTAQYGGENLSLEIIIDGTNLGGQL